MSGANVAGAETWRLETEDRVMMTASPRYENSVLTSGLIGEVDTRFNVLPSREATGIGDDTLTCDNIVITGARPAGCHPEGSDTIRVAERDDAEACQHGDTGVCTLGLFHKSPNGVEYVFLIDSELARLLEVVGEYIKQKFGIRRGVNVAVGTSVHEMKQGICIDQIAIL
jgi:hypothetical protein